MATETLYMPIIKGKANDLKALGRMPKSLLAITSPLVELLPPDEPDKVAAAEQHFAKFASQIRKYCPGQAVNVDLHAISPKQLLLDGSPALELTFAQLHGLGVPFTPVFGFDHEPELWDRILPIVRSEGRGITFRIRRDDLQSASESVSDIVDRALSAGIKTSSINLSIDLGSIADLDGSELVEARTHVEEFIEYANLMADFGTLSLSASSMPRDVSDVPQNGAMKVSRREFSLWGAVQGNIRDIDIAYGDYGIIHPNFSDKIVATHANGKIRYTSDLDIHIFRGHSLRTGLKYGQYQEIAARVTSSKFYQGPDYSFGDWRTWGCARGELSTGNLGTWVEADMNHHMVFAAAQARKVATSIRAGMSLSEAILAPV